MSGPGTITYPMHLRSHSNWNRVTDCDYCRREVRQAAAAIAANEAWLDARRRHPSNQPGNVAHWDQVAARERDEAWSSARALAFVVVTLARVLFLSLAVVGVAADVPTVITVLCGALMLALLPIVLPRKAKP